MHKGKINPHGGDIYKASERYGISTEDLLDFSANINPLGVPDKLRELILSRLDSLTSYPDPDCGSLKAGISAYLDVPGENIIVGNGASEIIFLLLDVLRPGKILIPAPTFSEYAAAAGRTGASIRYHRLREENDFRLDMEELLGELEKDMDVVMLCNPNNPTSALIAKEELLRLAESSKSKGIHVIIDEAFIEMTEVGNGNSMVEYCKYYDNLFVIRAFTKLFAIPGLRLGYGIGNSGLVGRMWDNKLPWSVNGLACSVGEFLGVSGEYREKTSQWLCRELSWFYGELQKLPGIKVYKPETNFVLLKLTEGTMTSSELKDRMASKGVLIRDAGNFEFLDGSFARLAVKDRASNIRALETFRQVLASAVPR